MAKIQKLTPPHADEDVEQQEQNMVQSLWKSVWQVITKINILLTYDPAISFLGIYPKELEAYFYMKTCT